MPDEIVLVPYDPRWPALFEVEAEAIRSALSVLFPVTVDPIGSTAVPGMAAKPILDILLGLPDFEQGRRIIPHLENLGYGFWRDNPEKDHLFFVKGRPPQGIRRTHHVHVFRDPARSREHLLFRDYLRAHPEEARRYEALKRDLAGRYPDDREAYTNAKSGFIQGILKNA